MKKNLVVEQINDIARTRFALGVKGPRVANAEHEHTERAQAQSLRSNGEGMIEVASGNKSTLEKRLVISRSRFHCLAVGAMPGWVRSLQAKPRQQTDTFTQRT